MLEQLTTIIVENTPEDKLVANLLGDILAHEGFISGHHDLTELIDTELLTHSVQEEVEHIILGEVKQLHLVGVR